MPLNILLTYSLYSSAIKQFDWLTTDPVKLQQWLFQHVCYKIWLEAKAISAVCINKSTQATKWVNVGVLHWHLKCCLFKHLLCLPKSYLDLFKCAHFVLSAWTLSVEILCTMTHSLGDVVNQPVSNKIAFYLKLLHTSLWFHKEPLTSIKPFSYKRLFIWEKVLQII